MADLFSNYNVSPSYAQTATPKTSMTTLRRDVSQAGVDIISGLWENTQFKEDFAFNPANHINVFNQNYKDQLMSAKSEEEFRFIEKMVRREEQRFERYSRASGLAKGGAMVLDYTNLVPTFAYMKSPTVAAAIFNSAVTGGTLQGGIETARYYGGVNSTAERAITSVGSATIFSGALAGAFAGSGKAYRNFVIDQQRKFRDREFEIVAMENLQGRVDEFGLTQRKSRQHGNLSDDNLKAEILQRQRRVYGLNEGAKAAREAGDQADFAFKMRLLNETSDELKLLVDEASARIVDNATVDGVVDPYRIVTSAYNPIPSPASKALGLEPIKRAGQSVWDGLNMYKKSILQMGGDNGRITEANLAGVPSPESVYIAASTEKRHWARFDRLVREAYAEATDASTLNLLSINPTSAVRRFTKTGPTIAEFRVEANRKRLAGETPSSDAEAKVIRAIDEFYNEAWGARLQQANHIGRTDLETEFKTQEIELARVEAKLSGNLKKGSRQYFEERLSEVKQKMESIQSAIEAIAVAPAAPTTRSREPFFNRIYNVPVLKNNESVFKGILTNHFMQNPSYVRYNPETFLYERIDLNTADPATIAKAVDETYDSIVNDPDPFDPSVSEGFTGSLKLSHRMIDIDNKDILPFIINDPLVAMQNYTNRVAPKYHFSRIFGGKSPDAVWREIEDQFIVDGYDKDFIDFARLQFGTIENRVMSRVYRDPTRWDLKTATFLREFTSLNYLNKAGIASIPDFSRILMDSEFGDVAKASVHIFRSPEFRQAMRDTKDEIGEGLDVPLGAVQQRISEGLTDNVDPNGVWNNTKQAGMILNLLGPITEFMKTFEGALRQHTIIKYMRHLDDGTLTKFEQDYLNRYGISAKIAKEIVRKAPIQQVGGTNQDNGLLIANLGDWEMQGVSKEATEAFRNAVNNGVLNTIVTATPFDRPQIADGIVYIRTSTASKIPWAKNLPEDSVFKGYVRIESGMMTLPFQFYSFMFASMNKVTAAYTSGQVKNRLGGAFAAIGLGYLAIWARTPSYVWDKMEPSDRIARAFDYSGLAPLYSDLVYSSMQQAVSAGREPMMGKFVNPKYEAEPNPIDFLTGITGPATSTLQDIGESAVDIFNGELGQGFGKLQRNIPLNEVIFMDFIRNQFNDAFR